MSMRRLNLLIICGFIIFCICELCLSGCARVHAQEQQRPQPTGNLEFPCSDPTGPAVCETSKSAKQHPQIKGQIQAQGTFTTEKNCPKGTRSAVDLTVDADGTVKIGKEYCEEVADPPPPFDRKPEEWDGPDTVGTHFEALFGHPCLPYPGEKLHCDDKISHTVCAIPGTRRPDPGRFPIQDAAGGWHCLALLRKP